MRRHGAARQIAGKLPLLFDPAPLLADLERIAKTAFGPHTEGLGRLWEGATMWEEGSDIQEKDFAGPFARRKPLRVTPAFAAVLAALPGEKKRVRLARQQPRSHAPLHLDQGLGGLYRVHVPLATNPSVYFLVNRQRVVMKPGEAWHVNAGLPHEIYNLGRTVRVHLFVDLFPSRALDSLLAASQPIPDAPTAASRRRARELARRYRAMRPAAAESPAPELVWRLAALTEMAGAGPRRLEKP